MTVYTKYRQEEKSNVCQHKKIKLYDYYKCDYCGEEIRIEKNRIHQSGGIIFYKNKELALHNKCLKSFLKKEEG